MSAKKRTRKAFELGIAIVLIVVCVCFASLNVVKANAQDATSLKYSNDITYDLEYSEDY